MTDDTQALANKLVTLAVLRKMVAALDADVRESTQMALTPGDRKAAQAAGERIGYVLLTDPKGSYRVTDGDAWRGWVKANRPEELITVESVRSSFEAAMLARGCDDDGELLPGVSWVAGTPVLQVKPTAEAERHIRAELADGGYSFAEVLESFTPAAVGS